MDIHLFMMIHLHNNMIIFYRLSKISIFQSRFKNRFTILPNSTFYEKIKPYFKNKNYTIQI